MELDAGIGEIDEEEEEEEEENEFVSPSGGVGGGVRLGGGGGARARPSEFRASNPLQFAAAASKRISFAMSASTDPSDANLRGKSGVVINKLTSDLKWVERRLFFDDTVDAPRGALRISTQKMSGSDMKIPLASIAYVQVGSEELAEEHRDLVEPLKTMNSSPASLFISAGDLSVRIRLPDEEAAASLAEEIRELALRKVLG